MLLTGTAQQIFYQNVLEEQGLKYNERLLLSCIKDIAPNYLIHEETLFVCKTPHQVDYPVMDSILATICQELQFKISLLDVFFMTNLSYVKWSFEARFRPQQYLFIGGSENQYTLFDNIKLAIQGIALVVPPNSTARSLAVFINRDEIDKVAMRTYLAQSYQYRLYNTLYLLPEKEKSIPLIRWFLKYPNLNCYEGFRYILDKWLEDSTGIEHLKYRKYLFVYLYPKNMNGCKINILRFPDYSLTLSSDFETYVLETISSSFNISYCTSYDKTRERAHMYFGETKLSIVSAALKVVPPIAYPHYCTTLKWYVPCPKHLVKRGNFLKVFDWKIWALMIILITAASLVLHWIITSVKNMELIRKFKKFSDCLSHIWALNLGVSVPEIPQNFRLRAFLFLWISYTYTMSVIFQGFFTTYLVEPVLENEISSVDELIKSDLKLESYVIDYRTLCDFTEANKELCKKIDAQSLSEFSTLIRFLNNKDIAIFANEFRFRSLLSFLHEKRKYCSIDDGSISSYHFFLFEIDNYQTRDFFDIWVHRLLEGGIINRLNEKYVRDFQSSIAKAHDEYFNNIRIHVRKQIESENYTQRNQSAIDDEDIYNYFVFGVEHMKFAFLLLIAGLAGSLVTFLFEVIRAMC